MIEDHYSIGDLHLGHKRILDLDGRPFEDIEEHDQVSTENCCRPHKPGCTLWLVGDVAYRVEHLTKFMETIRPYWGKINLIRGNHDDRVAWKRRDLFDNAYEAHYLRIDKQTKVFFLHYACRTWRGSNRGSYHIHGHSHGALEPWGRSRDTGANCIDYAPERLDVSIAHMAEAGFTNHH